MSQNINLKCGNITHLNQIGEDIAQAINVGDVIGLEGEPGTGKTTLARAIIRSADQNKKLEVPSPTYSIIQQYDTKKFRITHADLYRIQKKSELNEIGLEDEIMNSVVIVEWPEKLNIKPSVNIKITETKNNQRNISVSGGENKSFERIVRSLEIRNFLEQQKIGNAKRQVLAGDASTRKYEILSVGGKKEYVLMDAANQDPKGKQYRKKALLAENINAFVAVQKLLNQHKFGAPKIFGVDYKKRLILMQNLGAKKIVTKDNKPIKNRYEAAVDTLAKIHQCKWDKKIKTIYGVHIIPKYTKKVMIEEVRLMTEWYYSHKQKKEITKKQKNKFIKIWENLLDDTLNNTEINLVLRDYHSPNIIWMNKKIQKDQIGIIDFQDAVLGPVEYDIASIIQDARVNMPEKLQNKLVRRYCSKRKEKNKKFNEKQFRQNLNVIQAQRATRILGTFVRLSQKDNKHEYLNHINRIEMYLKQTCQENPTLQPLQKWLREEVGI